MRTKEQEVAAYTWLTPAEVGQLAGGVDAETVRGWIREGKLQAFELPPSRPRKRPTTKTYREYRIKPEWADVFIKQHTVNARAGK